MIRPAAGLSGLLALATLLACQAGTEPASDQTTHRVVVRSAPETAADAAGDVVALGPAGRAPEVVVLGETGSRRSVAPARADRRKTTRRGPTVIHETVYVTEPAPAPRAAPRPEPEPTPMREPEPETRPEPVATRAEPASPRREPVPEARPEEGSSRVENAAVGAAIGAGIGAVLGGGRGAIGGAVGGAVGGATGGKTGAVLGGVLGGSGSRGRVPRRGGGCWRDAPSPGRGIDLLSR